MQPTAGAKRPSLTHGENPLPAAADAHRWAFTLELKRSELSLMKVFLSHATQDKEIARLFADLLGNASLGFIEPWFSGSLEGVKPGTPLFAQLHDALNETDRVVTLITSASLNRPWLLYESGYVAGRRGAQVIPLLFGVEKASVPSPLHDYVLYSGDQSEDLCRLVHQLLADVVRKPNRELVERQVQLFLQAVESLLAGRTDRMDTTDETALYSQLGMRFIDKLEASEIVHLRLADPGIRHVVVISYTNEVEAGAFTHYRLKGEKTIEVFKRSLLADLGDEQGCNLLRLSKGSSVRPWKKARISLDASTSLEAQLRAVAGVSALQRGYPWPPTKRVYLFDSREALIGYYEHKADPIATGGSLYKGMSEGYSLLVTDRTTIGRFLLDEVKQYLTMLRRVSVPWGLEREVLTSRQADHGVSRAPILSVRGVLLDMDGILYASLPQYVEAWTQGFREIGVTLPVEEVYREEGRRSQDTVRIIARRYGMEELDDQSVKRVLSTRARVLGSLGEPPLVDGARDLVAAIAAAHIPMGVVTGSSRPGIAERVTRDFGPLINHEQVVTGSDTPAGKPSPDPYLAGARCLGVDAWATVAIENAPLGAMSASRAGCFVIGVNTGVLPDSELEEHGARAVFATCGALASVWPEALATLKVELEDV